MMTGHRPPLSPAPPHLAAIALAICLSTAPAPAGPVVRYHVTDLGTLGGPSSRAEGINNAGQVVGTSRDFAFVWEGGVMLDLGAPLGGYWENVATGINDAGQVIGYSDIDAPGEFGEPVFHAFLYENGRVRDLGAPHHSSFAAAINNSGWVAGRADYPSGDGSFRRAFLWDGGSMRDLGTLGAADGQSFATDIDDAGRVVGGADTGRTIGTPSGAGEAAVYHAFLYEDGSMQDLGTLGGEFSWAAAMNDLGQVVGNADTAGDSAHAFLSENGAMRDLGTLGGDYSEAAGINEAGQVVGHSWTPLADDSGNPVVHAFLYEDGSMLDLNDLIPTGSGWVLTEATDINDRGWIVGVGTNPDSTGSPRAFLLTPLDDGGPGPNPIPLPPAAWTGLTGLTVLGGIGLRQVVQRRRAKR